MGYYGIDSSVLVAYLDNEHPDNPKLAWLSTERHATNPTVIHEAYHTMVFKQKVDAAQVKKALNAYASHASFLNQTLRTTKLALSLAVKHSLGGRDSLMLANYLLDKSVEALLTLDRDLLSLRRLKHGNKSLNIETPFR